MHLLQPKLYDTDRYFKGENTSEKILVLDVFLQK